MRFFIAFLLAILSQLSFAKELVVSTHPIFLIAQDVTRGVEEPVLLLSPQQSGHDINLTPKSRQLLQQSNLIIWLGEAHEAPLKSVLEDNRYAISLLDSPLVKVLPQRTLKGESIADTQDTHIWLEPNNAIRIAFFIAALRSQQHPEYKAQYWKNAQDFSKKMQDATKVAMDNKIKHYWAYHDAYQYLERALNLKFAGALSSDDHLAPAATQIHYLNRSRPQNNMCLLAEYHADKAIVNMLKPVKNVAVDETMSAHNNFIQGWIALANAVSQCK